MRVRIDKNANYRAVFFNGKTIRLRLDRDRPITAPSSAEIEDIAINSKCFANCSYCYTSATKHGQNFDRVCEKAIEIWGSRSENDRPFQIAIGGAGEPTLHPSFIDFVMTVRELNIVPNYTTNGMHLTPEVIDATEKYCGGVAVSYHPHIKTVFTEAIYKLRDRTRLNLHVIVGDKKSFIDLQSLYETYKDDVEYFVILPYQAVGRGKHVETHETWQEMFEWIAQRPVDRQKQFAFGALFYDWMLINKIGLDIDIYEPEIYSGYRMLDDSYQILRKSSYNLEPK